MNRHRFRAFRSDCRKRNWSRELIHNGRRWTIGRDDCQRLDAPCNNVTLDQKRG